ncbi:MAG TPA: DMT family transporter [Defluviicoccus sp.]|nr:DMT family transporter [Defluviicoccus sp.]
MTATTRPRAVGLLCLVIALWGANWPIMKVGLLDMPPLTFAAVRLLLATLTLFVISPRRLKLPAARDLPVVLSVGLLQLFAFMLCMYLALMVVPAGRSAILAYTTPIWVVPMATLWLGERMTPMKALALAIGLAGIGVLFNPAALDWGSRAVLIGNGLLLAAAAAWAITIVHVRGRRWQATPYQLLPWQMLLATLASGWVAFAFEGDATTHWTPRLIVILLYNGILASAFCSWAFNEVARSLPATTTSLGSLGVPVIGLLASAAWLGEPLAPSTVLGLVLILSAVALLVRQEIGARS